MNIELCCNFAAIKNTAMQARKYPIGIQTFERIREENYLYIDNVCIPQPPA